jgi:hypothetical protein
MPPNSIPGNAELGRDVVETYASHPGVLDPMAVGMLTNLATGAAE